MTQTDILANYLAPLGLGGWRYFTVVGSTNAEALEWAAQGAPDWALVVADAQTAGRGREGRRWMTEPGHALALSLVVRLSPAETRHYTRLAALGALGLIRALEALGLKATLKWPNDVLLRGKKVAGVLVEANWLSGALEAVVIGLGVNITACAVPAPHMLRYPATAVEPLLGAQVDRWALLADILQAMRDLRLVLGEDAFVETWNAHLAFRDTFVRFQIGDAGPQRVRVMGVLPDGRLAVQTQEGKRMDLLSGEILMGEDPA